MALAPASMVAVMVSGRLPPVAIMGTSGYRSRMDCTNWGVLAAAATFRMDAPASSLAPISV